MHLFITPCATFCIRLPCTRSASQPRGPEPERVLAGATRSSQPLPPDPPCPLTQTGPITAAIQTSSSQVTSIPENPGHPEARRSCKHRHHARNRAPSSARTRRRAHCPRPGDPNPPARPSQKQSCAAPNQIKQRSNPAASQLQERAPVHRAVWALAAACDPASATVCICIPPPLHARTSRHAVSHCTFPPQRRCKTDVSITACSAAPLTTPTLPSAPNQPANHTPCSPPRINTALRHPCASPPYSALAFQPMLPRLPSFGAKPLEDASAQPGDLPCVRSRARRDRYVTAENSRCRGCASEGGCFIELLGRVVTFERAVDES
ncbi:hypothetical protein C7974DRAFT_176671 [Boeremia exigua]|uniref:uncharacterized protein n=1 Tax=Boeremia exigua TaxID=749465 RepID=UPI001E8E87E8|nr:uncharacterized protein C7974DRAFT_176671 [Boeremia exigua]KAH6633673.1 hypothetical protein C7974DRAFT_176671 [Boeremia exigua]